MQIIVPTLTTQRLRLVPISFDVSPGMFALWSDVEVCRYSGEVRDYDRNIIPMPAARAADSDKIIDFWVRAAADDWGFRWAVMAEDSAEFLGAVGFNSLGDTAEIAYHMLPRYWGKGFMFEASIAALHWLTDRRTSTAVEALIEPDNQPSIALAIRLGLRATDEFSDGSQRYLMTF